MKPESWQDAIRWTNLMLDAVNLSGVAHDFPDMLTFVREQVHQDGGGTGEVNRHPLAIVWIEKMAELAGIGGVIGDEVCMAAFSWLREMTDHYQGDEALSVDEINSRFNRVFLDFIGVFMEVGGDRE